MGSRIIGLLAFVFIITKNLFVILLIFVPDGWFLYGPVHLSKNSDCFFFALQMCAAGRGTIIFVPHFVSFFEVGI